jgi:hypothetical protein
MAAPGDPDPIERLLEPGEALRWAGGVPAGVDGWLGGLVGLALLALGGPLLVHLLLTWSATLDNDGAGSLAFFLLVTVALCAGGTWAIRRGLRGRARARATRWALTDRRLLQVRGTRIVAAVALVEVAAVAAEDAGGGSGRLVLTLRDGARRTIDLADVATPAGLLGALPCGDDVAA